MSRRSKWNRSPTEPSFPIGLLAVSAGIAALVAWNSQTNKRRRPRPISDAPQRTLRSGLATRLRENTVVGRAVTINKSRHELYAFWRDFSHLPAVMDNINGVQVIDAKRSRWTIAAPGGEVSFLTTIVEDRPDEVIAWRSDASAAIRNSGRIEFRDAPGGRGTIVEATIAYDAPGGDAGRLLAKLFQREPGIQARRDLKRFKQIMETGEIATSASRPASPRRLALAE